VQEQANEEEKEVVEAKASVQQIEEEKANYESFL
jgi:hypothetical protein